jgi:hypothetical protein
MCVAPAVKTDIDNIMRLFDTQQPGLVQRGTKHDGWHTLTLDMEGHIISSDQDLEQLLGFESAALTGKTMKTLIPTIPFSEKTPGYNLAYAIVHGAKGAEVRRTARSADGKGVLVDTVLSSRNVKGHRNITLKLRGSSSGKPAASR